MGPRRNVAERTPSWGDPDGGERTLAHRTSGCSVIQIHSLGPEPSRLLGQIPAIAQILVRIRHNPRAVFPGAQLPETEGSTTPPTLRVRFLQQPSCVDYISHTWGPKVWGNMWGGKLRPVSSNR